jgi:hypothetical protein
LFLEFLVFEISRWMSIFTKFRQMPWYYSVVNDLHTIIVITDLPVFIFLGIPMIIGLTFFFGLVGYSSLLKENQKVIKDNSKASLNLEKETEKFVAYNPKQLLLIFGSPFFVLTIAMFIPEYRELARVEFDGNKMYFKNVYGVMITEPARYSDILEVSTVIRANHSKQIMISTLRGDYISSHMIDEKKVDLAQTKILTELQMQNVKPFTGGR